MRLRRRSVFVLAALLGAAVAVMPAVAGSETVPPTVTAFSESGEGIYKYPAYWSPERTAIAQPGSVQFTTGSSTQPHGIIWTSPTIPTCEGSVPVGSSKTGWSGKCSFSQAGEYTFYCAYHGPSMHGVIVVAPNGETTSSSTSNPPVPTGTGTGGSPTTPGVAGGGGAGSPSGAASGLKLSFARHSSAVTGSVQVGPPGVGGRLEVDLLARRASLARTGAPVNVGRLVRTSLPAGAVSFRVPVSARGRAALRRHHRLPLTVKVTVTPAHGSGTSIVRALTLHR